ncbi:MAG: hypothetical protein JOS17DRAFT_775356 [Linnemannia elongata]|nr:MAG: hypothetical protein JOS17DRAFT_775356 [Linnemannia elongata]
MGTRQPRPLILHKSSFRSRDPHHLPPGLQGLAQESLANPMGRLVKRSPRLKPLVSYVRYSDSGLRQLAETLGTSCPDLESLAIHDILQTQDLETFIRRCSPGRPQLRKLHFAVQSLEDGGHQSLVATILRHASTLEDVNIYRNRHGMDASVCLRLLTECPRLTHFTFFARHFPFDWTFLETLKQQDQQQAAWRCRETLQELNLGLGFFGLKRCQSGAERQEKAEILSEMGWEIVDKDEEDDEPIDGGPTSDPTCNRNRNPKRPPDITHLGFKPKTILTCLLVSKLWYKTLLPVLWYSYRSGSMDEVPDAVIRRNSSHFRILSISQWSQWSYRGLDFACFECTKLVELDIYLDEGGGGGSTEQDVNDEEDDGHGESGTFYESSTGRRGTRTGEEHESRTVVPLPDAKRLLRTNPRLKCLTWAGPVRSTTALDVEDLVGLTGLESLSLDRWDCSDGRLDVVLKSVAGSLKMLCVGWICGVETGHSSAPLSPVSSTSPSPSPPAATTAAATALQSLPRKIRNGVDNGRTNTTDEHWMLPRLEELVWSGGELDDEYLSDLVKRCPRLKNVTLYVNHGGWDFDRLAASLGSYCPDIETLEIDPVIETHDVETLIRHCSPNRPQLRKLRIAVNGSNELGLVSAILPHASTLEDFEIYRTQDEMDGPLKQTRAERVETKALLSEVGGWVEVKAVEEENGGDYDEYEVEPFDMVKLRQVLELVQVQELKELEVLILDEAEFWRNRPIS